VRGSKNNTDSEIHLNENQLKQVEANLNREEAQIKSLENHIKEK